MDVSQGERDFPNSRAVGMMLRSEQSVVRVRGCLMETDRRRSGGSRTAFSEFARALGSVGWLAMLLIGGFLPMCTAQAEDSYQDLTLPDFIQLWDFDHPDSTEGRFRAILPRARASGDVDYTAQLLTQIARTEGLQRKFDAADATLDEVERTLRPEMSKARVRYLLERGRVHNSSGKTDQAKPLFVAAWDLARETKQDALAVDAAHMIAIVEPPDSAIAWNEKAIAYAEVSEDPRAQSWLGSLYNNIGWSYHELGDYPKALGIFKKGWDWRAARGQTKETLIAKWCVARTLRSLGQFDEALAMQRELLAAHEEAGGEDGFVYEEMGECLLAQGLRAEARPWFAKAFASLSKEPWLETGEKARLTRLADLGGASAGE
jgi:tetratricopeptide (TPR) repeat protein